MLFADTAVIAELYLISSYQNPCTCLAFMLWWAQPENEQKQKPLHSGTDWPKKKESDEVLSVTVYTSKLAIANLAKGEAIAQQVKVWSYP